MNWFKFYGQEYLTDPKMMSLTAVEKALWLTILCLASSNNGVIEHISEQKLLILTGIMPTDDEWLENDGFINKFEQLGMITNDNEMITLTNYNKRQSSNLSSYERVKRHREKVKSEAKNDNKDNVINDNARIDKNRIDKNNNILATDVAVSTNDLISLFSDVNPSYKTLYSNKTQRSALDRMTKEHGEEKIKWAISALKKSNSMKYAPVITTPLELEKKLGQLIAFWQKQKEDKPQIAVMQ